MYVNIYSWLPIFSVQNDPCVPSFSCFQGCCWRSCSNWFKSTVWITRIHCSQPLCQNWWIRWIFGQLETVDDWPPFPQLFHGKCPTCITIKQMLLLSGSDLLGEGPADYACKSCAGRPSRALLSECPINIQRRNPYSPYSLLGLTWWNLTCFTLNPSNNHLAA